MTDIQKCVLADFKRLLSERLELDKVILFGSVARGDDEPESDVDVLVVLKERTPEADATVSECAWEAGFEHGVLVAPITFGRDQWENGPERQSLLGISVTRDGIAL